MTNEEKKPERKTYKFYPIRVCVCLRKLVDIAILHPLGHHSELVLDHRHAYQWQHVRMTKGFPCHGLLTKPLLCGVVSLFMHTTDVGCQPL